MGSSTSQISSLDDCLLTKEQVKSSQIGDKFDHRDEYGLFAKAKILDIKGTRFYIHYIGYDKKWDTWTNYKENKFAFAKYKSISHNCDTSHHCIVWSIVIITSWLLSILDKTLHKQAYVPWTRNQAMS